MAATKTIAASARSGVGKGAARSVRREGRVPGVVYGGGEAPEAISLDYREVNKLIYAGHFLTTIFDMEIDGKHERVIPRDYQLDVIKDTPLHVDFLRLKGGARIKLAVPVHFLNTETAPGIKAGGTLNIVRHAIDMMVPGDRIPEAIEVDVGTAEINDSIHISAVKLPAGCQPVDRRDFTVANVVPPTVLSAAEVSEEAALAAGQAAASAAAKTPPAAKAAPSAKAPAAPAAKK